MASIEPLKSFLSQKTIQDLDTYKNAKEDGQICNSIFQYVMSCYNTINSNNNEKGCAKIFEKLVQIARTPIGQIIIKDFNKLVQQSNFIKKYKDDKSDEIKVKADEHFDAKKNFDKDALNDFTFNKPIGLIDFTWNYKQKDVMVAGEEGESSKTIKCKECDQIQLTFKWIDGSITKREILWG